MFAVFCFHHKMIVAVSPLWKHVASLLLFNATDLPVKLSLLFNRMYFNWQLWTQQWTKETLWWRCSHGPQEHFSPGWRTTESSRYNIRPFCNDVREAEWFWNFWDRDFYLEPGKTDVRDFRSEIPASRPHYGKWIPIGCFKRGGQLRTPTDRRRLWSAASSP